MHNKIIRFLWGDLSKDEIRKFSLLALGFFIIIGSYWPLKALKDSVFINIVGPRYFPEAKTLSLLAYFPLILLYSKVIDYFSKENIIYFFVTFFGLTGLFIVYFLSDPVIGLSNLCPGPHRILGWVFYVFIESYINLIVSIYWSFINDITTPESAKKGYGMIAFGTQLGGFSFTLLGSYLSQETSLYSSRVPLIALISFITFFALIVVVWSLKHLVEAKSFEGYVGSDDTTDKNDDQKDLKEEAGVGFFDGIKILISRPYVGGIFGMIFLYEAVTTMMSFKMYGLVGATFFDPGQVNKFIFNYALAVQFIACVIALFGTSFFQRKLGIRFCLVTYPVLLGLSIGIYLFYPTLGVISCVMVLSKALNYSFNQPAKEVLYIPTSKEIKYKSKAWIDVFGARLAKTVGSGLHKTAGAISGVTPLIALVFIGFWIFLSDKIGRKFHKIVSKNELIQ